MARLIDAEAFLEAMEEYAEYSSFDHYKEEPSINISFETLEEIVAEQPTAYDVDAVVEELEKKREESRGLIGKPHMDYGTLCGCYGALFYSIEIVKAGGVE